MAFDFATVPDLAGGDSFKWNRYADRDVLPLWVADMDFAAPPAVVEALRRRVDRGHFGYPEPTQGLVDAVVGHLERAFGWAVDPGWIVWLPGVVSGLAVACRAVDGDVFTATPVYPPFLTTPGAFGRRLATAPLILADGRWQWDFGAVAGALAPATRLWLLSHPHNPVGRCWSDAELALIADLAVHRDLVICCDEIWAGLELDPGRRHRPLASLSPEIARRTITLMAPSKTYNIPGLGAAFAVIPDPGLRRAFCAAKQGIVPHVNVLGLVAMEAAYRDAESWRVELLAALRANRDRVAAAVTALPGLASVPPEATFLAWIDARGLGVADPRRHFEAAGVGLSDGADFGAPGFVRLNFGCPAATLDRALGRIAAACG